MDAIVVNNVSKSYGKLQALSDVSFSVSKGEVFGLIGPDGAGKTSMFRILCSLLLPDAGTAAVDVRCVAGWGICQVSSPSIKTLPSRRI